MKYSLIFLSMVALLATAVFAGAHDKQAKPATPSHELTQAEIGRQRIRRAQYNPHRKQKRDMQARGLLDIGIGSGNVGAGINLGGTEVDTGISWGGSGGKSKPSASVCSGSTYNVCNYSGTGSSCCKLGLSCLPLSGYGVNVCLDPLVSSVAALSSELTSQGITSDSAATTYCNNKASTNKRRRSMAL